MNDDSRRLTIAHREAQETYLKLRDQLVVYQVINLVILGAMYYFDVPLKLMLSVGLLVAVGIVGALIMKLAFKLDIGRSYLEQCASDADKLLRQIEVHLDSSTRSQRRDVAAGE